MTPQRRRRRPPSPQRPERPRSRAKKPPPRSGFSCPAHRSDRGTPRSTSSTCAPHPAQLALPQVRHVVRRHILTLLCSWWLQWPT
ncbi:hypothetical protein ACFPRL_20525 [Pseudoclavibacter helvolus]